MTQIPVNVRRRPRQSRARFTQRALLESTVQLLREKPFEEITIREITDIAGVGLGTFYEYFSQKEDALALIMHQYIKDNIKQLQSFVVELLSIHHALNIQDFIAHVVQKQLRLIQQEQLIWANIFALERHLTTPQNYRKHYDLMMLHWQRIIENYNVQLRDNQCLIQNLQRIVYGFIAQTLLIEPDFKQWDQLEQDIFTAFSGFLA